MEWRISEYPVPYPDAVAAMERRVEAIRAGTEAELVWLLEHPPLYTAGTSARRQDLLQPDRFPVFATGRGGQYTYHGPGQRVAYVMLDLKRRDSDIRAYIRDLEEWLIRTLAQFNIRGGRREGRVGIWVDRGTTGAVPDQEDKIAAIGVRVRHWVSFHGVALNVEPNLDHFSGIVPCGIQGHGVTSFHDLGHLVTMPEVDLALKAAWQTVFDTSPVAPRVDPGPSVTASAGG
ncbi:MAG: lipoyl(octanoyl) transferase LipB [Azospirillaceae bacterium]|nr:lipoyl(octanoyl) transferase LipB [Azospirillaceae bacterium]